MKWTKTTALAVVIVLAGSYLYSSIRQSQLSEEVEERQFNRCTDQGNADCDLIGRFHDDCFDTSYRAEYRVRQFHSAEYQQCMNERITAYRTSKDRD